jgi:hypothetical protein
MKNYEDTRLLERKRRIDAERKAQAILRRRQQTMPGLATPATVAKAVVR